MAEENHTPPQPPQNLPEKRPEDEQPRQQTTADPADARAVRSAHNFIVAAAVVAVASLLLGSLLFGAVGLALGIVGLRKAQDLSRRRVIEEFQFGRMRRTAIFSIVLSACAMVISAAVIAMLYPYVAEMLEAGTSATVNSTWG